MLKEILSKSLKNNFRDYKEKFIQNCIQEFDILNKNDEMKLLLYNVFYNGSDLNINREYAINIIKSTILHNENPSYLGNNIIFRLKENADVEDFSDCYKIEKEIFNNFCLNSVYDLEFQDLLNFDCFKEEIVLSINEEVNLFHTINWQNFFINLFSKVYPSFQRQLINKEVYFLRNINEEISFGFRLDLKEFRRELKRFGSPNIPEMQFVVISKNGEKIVSDSNFHHPFFDTLFSLRMYILNEFLIENKDKSVEFKPLYQKEVLNDGRSRLFQSEENGIRYKKYALFKILLSSRVNNSYFDFLEVVIKPIIQ
jgi:hypothetical protein